MRYRTDRAHKRPLYIKLGIAIFGIFIIAGFVAWAMAPNKGTVLESTNQSNKYGSDKKQLNGKYVSFSYSGAYRLKKLTPGDYDYEMYDLSANVGFDKHLSVDVSRLEGGELNNDTSYTARLYHPDVYSHNDILVNGHPAVIFIKNDDSERTVFISNGNKVAILAFVSKGGLEDISSEITAVLNSFHWKE